jgi:colicin import membrane protein
MENRSLSFIAALVLAAGCTLPSAAAWARSEDGAKPTPEQRADWDRRLEEAKRMQEEGGARKSEAMQAFEARKKECFKKFRVTGCQEEARQQYLQAAREARHVENDGKEMERRVRKEELADKDARRLAREPDREADLRAREAETRAEREHSESSRTEKLAEKDELARAGAERRAAAEERQRRKQEAHEKKLAERMAKARQREAEAGR